jgi:hypothetical protein
MHGQQRLSFIDASAIPLVKLILLSACYCNEEVKLAPSPTELKDYSNQPLVLITLNTVYIACAHYSYQLLRLGRPL